jgi:hypothetical protein
MLLNDAAAASKLFWDCPAIRVWDKAGYVWVFNYLKMMQAWLLIIVVVKSRILSVCRWCNHWCFATSRCCLMQCCSFIPSRVSPTPLGLALEFGTLKLFCLCPQKTKCTKQMNTQSLHTILLFGSRQYDWHTLWQLWALKSSSTQCNPLLYRLGCQVVSLDCINWSIICIVMDDILGQVGCFDCR